MGDVSLVDKSWDLGFISDIPRDQLPKGAAYRMKDWIPNQGSPLRRRGGWSFASSVISSGLATDESVVALGWTQFSGDEHLVALTSEDRVYKIKSLDGTDGTRISTNFLHMSRFPPFWHKDRLIIGTESNGTNPRKYYDSGAAVYAVADVGGTPPQFRVGCSWGDYLVGANGYVGGTLFANRSWFSGVGTPDVWTPSTSYVDLPEQVLSVVSRPNYLLYFGYNGVHQLVGTVPPPGGDMTLKKYVFNQGTFDARSVAVYKDQVIWANNNGVWKTDGTTITSLTEQGGISQFWQDAIGSTNSGGGFIPVRGGIPSRGDVAAAGIYRGHYVISIVTTASPSTIHLVCDLERSVWFEFTGIQPLAFAGVTSSEGTNLGNNTGSEKLFFGRKIISTRVGELGACWSPSVYSSDAANTGTAVTPVLETAYYKLGATALKRIRRVFLSYLLSSAGGSPTLQVDYLGSPESTSYTTLASLAKSTKMVRRALQVRKKLLGVAFRITQVAASDDTRLHGVEIEAHALEGTRR